MFQLSNLYYSDLIKSNKIDNSGYILINYENTLEEMKTVKFISNQEINVKDIKKVHEAFYVIENSKKQQNILETIEEKLGEDNAIVFSVIMPLYNNEKYVEAAVNSVLNQTFKGFELIIIDDKSTDKSFEVIKDKFENNPKVRIYQNEINMGCYDSQNIGLTKATGKYLTFIGSDDVFSNNRLENDYKYLKKKNVNIVLSKYQRIASDRKTILRESYGSSMLTFDRVIYEKLGGFLSTRYGGDGEYYLRIQTFIGKNKIYRIPKVLYTAYFKNDKSNLSTIYSRKVRAKFTEYYNILHNNKKKKIQSLSKLDKILLERLKNQLIISNQSHLYNISLFNIKI